MGGQTLSDRQGQVDKQFQANKRTNGQVEEQFLTNKWRNGQLGCPKNEESSQTQNF